MLKQVYEIDEFGHRKSILVKEFDEHGNCTEELAENIITVDIPQGLYRAKWAGTEWVEDMSQAEIDALNNQLQEPTEIEKLKERLATAEQVAVETSITQQELLELLLEMGVI